MSPFVSDVKQLIPTLTRIDECLAYFDTHVSRIFFFHLFDQLKECSFFFKSSFKQSLLYKNQMKQVLFKALNVIKGHITHILENSSHNIDPNKVRRKRRFCLFKESNQIYLQSHTLLSDDAFTLFYGRFRVNAPKVKVLAEELEQRCSRNVEFVELNRLKN